MATEELDNPAGRLHALLSRYREAASTKVTILDTWASVLDVETSQVRRELAAVAALIAAIQQAVDADHDPRQQQAYDYWVDKWAEPIIHPRAVSGSGNKSPGDRLVDRGALVALGSMSSHLSRAAREGQVPDEDHLAKLLDDVDRLAADVAATGELPEELREVLEARLNDLRWAVGHVRIVGPNGVREAAERLAGAYAFAGDDTRNLPVMQRVYNAASAAWIAFTVPGQAQSALMGWSSLVERFPQLGSGG